MSPQQYVLLLSYLLPFYTGIARRVGPWLSTFLAIWWFPGAFVLTFRGPFLFAGNGFFASWASFMFAILWFQVLGGVAGSMWDLDQRDRIRILGFQVPRGLGGCNGGWEIRAIRDRPGGLLGVFRGDVAVVFAVGTVDPASLLLCPLRDGSSYF